MAKKSNLQAQDKKSNSVWLLILGVSVITIYFNTELDDPFNTPKLILLLLLTGWILGHLVNSYREKPISLKSSEFKILVLSLIFIVTLLISTLLTDVKIIGFIGDTQRRNGFFGYFGLVVILLYASRTINFNFSIRLIKCALFVGIILSSYGVMQIFGKDFVSWNNPYNSMISTLGNPNFASALLAILSVIAVGGLFIKSLPIMYKLFGALLLFMAVFSIIKSHSRQGLVTLLFASLFYVAIYTYFNYKKLRIIIIPISLVSSGLTILGMLQKGPLSSYLYKDSVSVRGYYWRAGIEMFKSKPLTGIGVDRYGAYFKEFREVSYPLKYGYEITSSNAHNTIIQLFATAGVFVGLTYLARLFYILFSGLKLVKNTSNDQQKITLVLLTSWIGFQAQSLISIDNIGISVWGWLLGGAILGLAHQSNTTVSNDTIKNSKTNIVRINIFQPTISAIFLIPILLISSFLYKFEKDTYMVRVFASSTTQEGKSMLVKYFDGVTKNPLADPYSRFNSSLILYDAGFSKESYAEINKLLKSDPRNLYFLRSVSYYASQQNDLNLSIKSLEKIAQVDPWNAVNYNALGALYGETSKKEEAKKMFQKVLDFAPNTEQAKLAKENLDKL